MKVEILTIGDELLLGHTIDTNGAYIARRLAEVGISVARRTAVADEAEEIAAGVREALDRTGAVITTGGLGPTADDLTKPSIAALFGCGLVLHEDILEAMRERWKQRWNRPLPDANRQQAMLPEGARVLVNRHGSAPGVFLEDARGRWVAMLPGVPREARGMTDDELIPFLLARGGTDGAGATVVRSRTLRTTGISESLLADRLADVARGLPGMPLAYLPGWEGTDLRLTSRGLRADATDAALDGGLHELRERVGLFAYGDDDTDLAAVVIELLRARGWTIAVAESCTGGMLGQRLTAVPGSSDVFLGGIVAYANVVKTRELAVPVAMLEQHGAVSEAVARQMSSAVRQNFEAGVGISITGVAGPGGGTADKPVGTVWISVDLGGDNRAQRMMLIGDRQEIRLRATQAALDMVRRGVLGH